MLTRALKQHDQIGVISKRVGPAPGRANFKTDRINHGSNTEIVPNCLFTESGRVDSKTCACRAGLLQNFWFRLIPNKCQFVGW